MLHPLCFKWCGEEGEFFQDALLKWAPLVVLNKYNVLMIGDLIQSFGDMRGRFSDLSCLTNMYVVSPLYTLTLIMSHPPFHLKV